MLEIKQRTKNIEDLNKIISKIEKDDSFIGFKNELKEYKDEFYKELQPEQNIKLIEQSKINWI